MPGTTTPKIGKRLLQTPLQQVLAALDDTVEQFALSPDPQALDAVASVVDATMSLGLTHYEDLLDQAAQIIRRVTEVSALTCFTSQEKLEEIHRHRNALGALLAAVAISHGTRPHAVLKALPAVAPRSADRSRPLTHDEVVLARLVALHTARANDERKRRAAWAYLVADTGGWPSEASELIIDRIDRRLGRIAVSGVTGYAIKRTLQMDEFGQALLGVLLTHEHPTGVGLVYRGEAGAASGAARACVSRMLLTLLDKAGVVVPTEKGGYRDRVDRVSATSITAWRIDTVREHSPARAAQIAGFGDAVGRMYHAVGRPVTDHLRRVDEDEDGFLSVDAA